MSQANYNINLQEGRNYEDIQHPDHPDLNSNYLLVYLHYQHKLYSQIYGIEAIESDDIQQFKDSLKIFDLKRLNILKCFLFAKSCNLSRNNGDDLLKLIRLFCPSPQISLPNSWKSVTRAISEQSKY